MKQRQGWKVIISKEAQAHIDHDECPACGLDKRLWKRRKDWRCCSPECTKIFTDSMVYYGWAEIRLAAFKRDKFTCAKCGKRPKNTRTIKYLNGYQITSGEGLGYYEQWPETYVEPKIIKNNPPTIEFVDPSLLIGDHIKPISLGGEEFDIDNVQTLCIPCDKIKTKADMKDIATRRLREKLIAKGQVFLK